MFGRSDASISAKLSLNLSLNNASTWKFFKTLPNIFYLLLLEMQLKAI